MIALANMRIPNLGFPWRIKHSTLIDLISPSCSSLGTESRTVGRIVLRSPSTVRFLRKSPVPANANLACACACTRRTSVSEADFPAVPRRDY